MLNRDQEGASPELDLMGFLTGVEVAKGGPTSKDLINHIYDALNFVEGVGKINVEYLGSIGFSTNADGGADFSVQEDEDDPAQNEDDNGEVAELLGAVDELIPLVPLDDEKEPS